MRNYLVMKFFQVLRIAALLSAHFIQDVTIIAVGAISDSSTSWYPLWHSLGVSLSKKEVITRIDAKTAMMMITIVCGLHLLLIINHNN